MTMNSKTFVHAIAHGALSKGGSVQVQQVLVGETPDEARATGILVVITKQTSSADPTVQIFVGRREFATLDEALRAWEAVGC